LTYLRIVVPYVMKIVRLRPYLRAMERMALDDEAMRDIELGLVAAPEAHPIIKGLRGVRKARFALPGRGKSGGGRVIYYVAVRTAIYMMTAYPKNERDDLSPDQRKAILAAIESLKEN
jgi:hypothetical protein